MKTAVPLLSNLQKETVENLIYEVSNNIVRANFKNPVLRKRSKSRKDDLQTDADVEAEKAFKAGLLKILPGSAFLGEEEYDENPIIIKNLDKPDLPVWVVDPIDGTYNFYHGHPRFGLMIALVVNGTVIHGWIYDIPGDRLAVAEKGGGATLNGKRLRFDAQDLSLDGLKGFAFRRNLIQKNGAEEIAETQNKNKMRFDYNNLDSYRCAAHEYLGLLEGERDFSLYGSAKPWDHLSGSLILAEAGGLTRRFDGTSYNPSIIKKGLINCRSKKVLELIQPFLASRGGQSPA